MLNVKEGDRVSKGQVIGVISEADLETQIENARIALENAQLSLKNAQEKLEEATKELEKYNAVAPIDGTVLQCSLTEGQEVSSGQGITIADGNAAQTSVTSDRTPIAQVESAPLSSVMAFMLRHSDNTLAEEFGRLLALHTKQGNSPTAATAAVRAQLEKLGVDVTGLTMADCSGLTPGSTLTATTLVQVQERNLQVGGAVAAAEGLAIPGLVGTAANRLGSAQAAGLTRVKTGNLQAVSSMTGNVSREHGGVAAFAVIVNNPQDFTATRSAIDTFVAGLTAL